MAEMSEAISLEKVPNEHEGHPLLDDLKGVIYHLQRGQQPITDGQDHLIPLCETIEAIFRNGLKKPNSWFGLNKLDYWSWIEPLQDYYFNEKQNPLLRQVVAAIAASPKLHSVEGRGRCFIRVALCQKLISVPVEHLVKNIKLTQYWYKKDSIVANIETRKSLMELLFEITAMDFQLLVDHSSFLDESWVIPVFKEIHLPPIKTLDIKVNYVDGHALIVAIEPGSLLSREGVEDGDILDELCGEQVLEDTHGRLKQILLTNSTETTDLLIIKEHLPDGCPFFPIVKRQLMSDQKASKYSLFVEKKRIPQRRPSILVQTQGSTTEYTIVYLGPSQDRIVGEPEGKLMDHAVSSVLNSSKKPEEVVLSVSKSDILLMNSGSREVRSEFSYEVVYGCGRGSVHQTCLVLLVAASSSTEAATKPKKEYLAHVLEAPSTELAQAICAHIAQGFNRSVWLRDKYS